VPLTSWGTAHYGRLLVYQPDGLHYAPWSDPRWIVVLGGLGFSAKSVYHWTLSAFSGDRLKAGGFVAMCELSLLLAPHPYLAAAAIAYLVAINMLSAGSALALRDQSDRAVPPSFAPAQLSQVRALSADSVSAEDADDELYERALAHVRSGGRASGQALRKALNVGSARAGALARRLASEGALASDAAE